MPELVSSPWTTAEHELESGSRAKKWRIDLVLFVNGLPVVTLELKSEFKQAVQNAIRQYRTTRFAIDPAAKKPEPLLTFKRGALVHFAVSQYEVYMATRLEGNDTYFLPFNKGTAEGGAGNDAPANIHQYATDYLWNEVLLPENLRKLIDAARTEGPEHKYLIQHSAGSGKSNFIAWSAHQLSALHTGEGHKLFDSIIVVTDRTVLDDQLQETISQFTSTEAVVGRINRSEGDGSKSEKLAAACQLKEVLTIDSKDDDLVNYAHTIRDKVRENTLVMHQLANNTPEQALLGDLPKAIDDAILSSNEAHQNIMMQLLSDPIKADRFSKLIFNLLRYSD